MTPPVEAPRRLAVVGGGWAGLAAAVSATQRGDHVTVLEASRHWGGRARSWPSPPHHGANPRQDNGQHILIGAYAATLSLMETVGTRPQGLLQPVGLNLRFADGSGLAIPPGAQRWPAACALLAAIATARGWRWSDRWALLRHSWGWRSSGFTCPEDCSVASWASRLPPRVREDLIEPLCVAALNTPMERASARVFLRVLQDALTGPGWGPYRASTLLLPRVDLAALLPAPAVAWLEDHGAVCHLGARVTALTPQPSGWLVHTATQEAHFDQVVLACPAAEAARLVRSANLDTAWALAWATPASGPTHEAIATCYLQAPMGWRWPGETPMLALRGAPAQFVLNRSELGGGPGELAWVASACTRERAALEAGVLAQAEQQLGLRGARVLRTVVEKRATFACVPGLQRPGTRIATDLCAAGDHLDGPYPATLESAVRSGLAAIAALNSA